MMKRTMFAVVALLAFLSVSAFAQKKNCDDLKMEIAEKLEAKGVKNYELKIVAAADVKSDTVVGSCEGGTKKITYSKK
jgi:hypothetical protein